MNRFPADPRAAGTWYRRTVLATILSLVFAATAFLIFNAFDLDDWNNLTQSQVEKTLVKQHHAISAHRTDIPNDGDETLRGYEYTCFVKLRSLTFGVWVAVNSSRITETEGMG